MTKFEELQAMHEHLMEQSKSPEDAAVFVDEVQHEIHNMCVAAEDISAPRERDQLRAILRFWASYVYDRTGTYPDTTLHPAKTAPRSEEPTEPEHARPPLLWIALAAGAVFIVLLIAMVLKPELINPPSVPPLPTAEATAQVTTARPSPFQPQIQWSVLTSGPSPFDANVWVVKLQISATGGNDSYIFWVNGTSLPDASNNQFTVAGKGCNPEKPIVGVTSGGQATSLELVIQSPLTNCQQP